MVRSVLAEIPVLAQTETEALGKQQRLFVQPLNDQRRTSFDMTPALLINGNQIAVRGGMLKIGSLEADKYLFLDEPQAILDGLRNCGKRVDLFTFIQRVSEVEPKYDYPMEWDNFAALRITTFEDWWDGLKPKRRNTARQAGKKGVELREIPFDDRLVEGIWRIYNECPVRQGKPFPHYGMALDDVHPYAGTFLDRSVFIGAYLDELLIGFAKLTIDQAGKQAGLMHIISMIEHRDKSATNALIAEAIRVCANRGVPYLIYSNFAYGNKQHDSLSDFKRHNGFERIDVPRYFVPLTTLGRAALRLGLHHRLIDRLPGTVISRFRTLRSCLYGLKLRPLRGED